MAESTKHTRSKIAGRLAMPFIAWVSLLALGLASQGSARAEGGTDSQGLPMCDGSTVREDVEQVLSAKQVKIFSLSQAREIRFDSAKIMRTCVAQVVTNVGDSDGDAILLYRFRHTDSGNMLTARLLTKDQAQKLSIAVALAPGNYSDEAEDIRDIQAYFQQGVPPVDAAAPPLGGQPSQLDALTGGARQEFAKCTFFLKVPPNEAEAWRQGIAELEKCGAGIPEPYPRDQMIKISACGTTFLDGKIKPVSHSPAQFALYMADRSVDHQLYAGGKLSWDEMRDRGNRRLGKYLATGSGSYFRYSACSNEVMTDKVLPTYPFKSILTDYMASLSAFALLADEKKMANSEFQTRAQSLWAELVKKDQEQVAAAKSDNK